MDGERSLLQSVPYTRISAPAGSLVIVNSCIFHRFSSTKKLNVPLLSFSFQGEKKQEVGGTISEPKKHVLKSEYVGKYPLILWYEKCSMVRATKNLLTYCNGWKIVNSSRFLNFGTDCRREGCGLIGDRTQNAVKCIQFCFFNWIQIHCDVIYISLSHHVYAFYWDTSLWCKLQAQCIFYSNFSLTCIWWFYSLRSFKKDCVTATVDAVCSDVKSCVRGHAIHVVPLWIVH